MSRKASQSHLPLFDLDVIHEEFAADESQPCLANHTSSMGSVATCSTRVAQDEDDLLAEALTDEQATAVSFGGNSPEQPGSSKGSDGRRSRRTVRIMEDDSRSIKARRGSVSDSSDDSSFQRFLDDEASERGDPSHAASAYNDSGSSSVGEDRIQALVNIAEAEYTELCQMRRGSRLQTNATVVSLNSDDLHVEDLADLDL
mmetsp:Transcript_125543/g.360917  ORF Transcript_125543/g.360917 Transcript_125543/m.360917 type:complete len:201 (+) Transcript_125543:68-670(+)